MTESTDYKRKRLLKSLACFIQQSWIDANPSAERPSFSNPEDFARWVIFPRPGFTFIPAQAGYESINNLPVGGLEILNHYLCEYVATYKKKDGDEFAPRTLHGNAFCLQQGIKLIWKYKIDIMKDSPFRGGNESFYTVLDNKVRSLQAGGNHAKPHNVLSRTELETLFRSASLQKTSAMGWVNRIVFIIGILTGFRNEAAAMLKLSQIKAEVIDNVNAYTITGSFGDMRGLSKGSNGGLRDIDRGPVQVTIFDEFYESLNSNFYEDVHEFLEMRKAKGDNVDRLLMAISPSAIPGVPNSYYTRNVLGKNKFNTIVKTVCINENVRGRGPKDYATMHSLRKSMIQVLVDAGHSDVAIAKRTNHRDIGSMRKYTHIQGQEGHEQQRTIAGVRRGLHSTPGGRLSDIAEAKDVVCEPHNPIVSSPVKDKKLPEMDAGMRPDVPSGTGIPHQFNAVPAPQISAINATTVNVAYYFGSNGSGGDGNPHST